jgi:hypothetical protein
MASRLRVLALATLLTTGIAALAQIPTSAAAIAAEQDHQNMMDQLGIKTLRPGPSGDGPEPRELR